LSAPLLRHVPSEDELARMYGELSALGAPAGGEHRSWPYEPRSREELICLAAEMARYDARLLTILVAWHGWLTLNPLELRGAMRTMAAPQALCVVLTFVRGAATDDELRRFSDYVCGGWPRVAPPERFFFDLERPHTKLAERRMGRSLTQYSRWGFVATERPQIDVFDKRAIGHYDQATRLDVLRRLAQRRGELRIAEYLAEIDDAVSRHQAVLDARAVGLVQRGRKRGTRWAWPRRGMAVRVRRGDVSAAGEKGPKVLHLESPRNATVLAEPDARGRIAVKLGGRRWIVSARDLSASDSDAPPKA
jgi:hypothetical protein